MVVKDTLSLSELIKAVVPNTNECVTNMNTASTGHLGAVAFDTGTDVNDGKKLMTNKL